MHDNLLWFFENGLIAQSAAAYGSKIDSNLMNLVAFMIDCNCMSTDRPGGGPAERGANAARWHTDLQRSLFNGWKSIHGLKHQTVDIAHGITVDICGYP